MNHFKCINQYWNWLHQWKFIITSIFSKLLTFKAILKIHHPQTHQQQTKAEISKPWYWGYGTLFAALPCLWPRKTWSSQQCECDTAPPRINKPHKWNLTSNPPVWPRKVILWFERKNSWGNVKLHSRLRTVSMSS